MNNLFSRTEHERQAETMRNVVAMCSKIDNDDRMCSKFNVMEHLRSVVDSEDKIGMCNYNGNYISDANCALDYIKRGMKHNEYMNEMEANDIHKELPPFSAQILSILGINGCSTSSKGKTIVKYPCENSSNKFQNNLVCLTEVNEGVSYGNLQDIFEFSDKQMESIERNLTNVLPVQDSQVNCENKNSLDIPKCTISKDTLGDSNNDKFTESPVNLMIEYNPELPSSSVKIIEKENGNENEREEDMHICQECDLTRLKLDNSVDMKDVIADNFVSINNSTSSNSYSQNMVKSSSVDETPKHCLFYPIDKLLENVKNDIFDVKSNESVVSKSTPEAEETMFQAAESCTRTLQVKTCKFEITGRQKKLTISSMTDMIQNKYVPSTHHTNVKSTQEICQVQLSKPSEAQLFLPYYQLHSSQFSNDELDKALNSSYIPKNLQPFEKREKFGGNFLKVTKECLSNEQSFTAIGSTSQLSPLKSHISLPCDVRAPKKKRHMKSFLNRNIKQRPTNRVLCDDDDEIRNLTHRLTFLKSNRKRQHDTIKQSVGKDTHKSPFDDSDCNGESNYKKKRNHDLY